MDLCDDCQSLAVQIMKFFQTGGVPVKIHAALGGGADSISLVARHLVKKPVSSQIV
jgi:hypothetical protein